MRDKCIYDYILLSFLDRVCYLDLMQIKERTFKTVPEDL